MFLDPFEESAMREPIGNMKREPRLQPRHQAEDLR